MLRKPISFALVALGDPSVSATGLVLDFLSCFFSADAVTLRSPAGLEMSLGLIGAEDFFRPSIEEKFMPRRLALRGELRVSRPLDVETVRFTTGG